MQRKSHSAHRSRKPQEISNLNKTTKNSRQTSPNSGDGIWKHYKKPKKKTGRNKDSKNWKDPSTVEHKSKRKINRLYLEYGTPIRNPKFQQISPSPSAHSSSEEESRELLMSIEGFSKRHKPYIEEESVLNTIQREYKEKENIRKANDRKFLIKRDTVALSSMNAKTRQRYSVLHPVIDPLIILHTPQKASKTPDSSPKRYYSPKLRTTKNKHAPKARDLLQIPPDFEELQREIVDEHDHPENKKTFPRKSVSIDLKYKTIQMMEDAHRKYKKFAEEGRKVLKVPKQWDQQQSVVEKIMGIHLIRNTRVGKAITHEWVLTLDRKEKMKFMHAPMHIKKMTRDQMIKVYIYIYILIVYKRLLWYRKEKIITSRRRGISHKICTDVTHRNRE